MELHIKPGKYIVAVSGGVDSVVLLDVLRQQSGLELVVAHFDHGIRSDSAKDRKFVEQTAQKYGLEYMFAEGHLGKDASEAEARSARYDFLRSVRRQYHADAIITAHHQDDVFETMLINMIRGTGRLGLSSLRSTDELLRPFVFTPKASIVQYALDHDISWHEDSTNTSDVYFRNYLRHHIMPRLTPSQRQNLVAIYMNMLSLNPQIDAEIATLLSQVLYQEGLLRTPFIQLTHAVACEVLAYWLRTKHAVRLERKQIERLVVAVKIAQPGTSYDIDKRTIMNISRKFAKVTPRSTRKTSA